MQLLTDILGFLKSLSQIDLLLYFSVVVLIILLVSLFYIIKNEEEMESPVNNEKEEMEELKNIVSDIENSKPPVLELTDYEAEQEEKAIISYEELLAKKDSGSITYEEETNDEISIKKVNVDALEKPSKNKKSVVFYNYEREEEFLKKLKALNELLN